MKLMFLTAAVLVFLVSGIAIADDDGSMSSYTSISSHSTPDVDATGDAFLMTLFARDNGFAGNSFDVTALTPLTIVGFDCNLDAGPTEVSVYYKEGTADGFELIVGEWTELGTISVTSAGSDLVTHVDIGGLSIDTDETYGIIIIETMSNMEYTNGGPTVYSNDDMTIETLRGLSLGWPPASAFEYRAWNGVVHYDYGVSLARQTWAGIKTFF